MSKDYTKELKNIGIILLEEFKGTKIHHLMKCDICDHQWTATPNSKFASFRMRGNNGCPSCNNSKKHDEITKRKEAILKKLLDEKNIQVLTSEYDGNQLSSTILHVRNTTCGHEFECSITNLLHKNITCSVCGIASRIDNLQNHLKEIKNA